MGENNQLQKREEIICLSIINNHDFCLIHAFNGHIHQTDRVAFQEANPSSFLSLSLSPALLKHIKIQFIVWRIFPPRKGSHVDVDIDLLNINLIRNLFEEPSASDGLKCSLQRPNKGTTKLCEKI